MNNQFIQRVIFDWNRIDNDSYLKGIEAFKGIEKLDFNKPITFFVGEKHARFFQYNNSDLLHKVNKVIDANENNLIIYIKNGYKVIVNEATIGTMYKKNKNKYFKKLHEVGAEFV